MSDFKKLIGDVVLAEHAKLMAKPIVFPVVDLPKQPASWRDDGTLCVPPAQKIKLQVDQNTGLVIYLRTDYQNQFQFECDGQLFLSFKEARVYCYRAYQAAR